MLPIGTSPANSEAAVAPDREFTSVLARYPGLAGTLAAAAGAALGAAADDVLDVEPVVPDCAAEICVLTRFSARALAMLAMPDAWFCNAEVSTDVSELELLSC